MSMKMDPDVKAEWVAALRSGRYGQTKEGDLLNTAGNYCCLGVLCQIEDAWPGGDRDGDMAVSQVRELQDRFNLSMEWQEHLANLNDFSGVVGPTDRLNERDTGSYNGEYNPHEKGFLRFPQFLGATTFNNIANYIEEHL